MLKGMSYKNPIGCIALALCLPVIFSISIPAQQIPEFVTLAKVEYQGLTLFTPAEINLVAGLKIGQHVDSSDLENAAKVLSYWGYFKTIQFNYRYSGAQLSVAFQVVENNIFLDCLFDNFLGFSDQELLRAIQKELPSFKGKVPASGTILQDIAHILEKYINRKDLRQQVSSSPVQGTQAMVFSIDNVKSPICKIDFEGDNKELLPILEQAAYKLINTPYSRWRIDAYSKQTISSFMQKQGYWKFIVNNIATEEISTSDCANGAMIKLLFNSGGKFIWSGAKWSGNTIKSVSELNNLLGVNEGDAAGQQAIEDGLINVAATYLKTGYIDYRLMAARPDIDYSNHRVSYQVEIKEGNQYRMGLFIPFNIPGLSLPYDKLIRQWRLRRGDIFDAVYFDEFKEKCFNPWCQAYAPNAGLSIAYGGNRNDMTVSIFVAPPPQPRPPKI